MADARVDHRDPQPTSKASHSSPNGKEEKLVKAIVARGRSIMVGKGQKVVGYHDITKEPIMAPICEYVDEFGEVELPESDVIFHRSRGYLVDPSIPPIMRSEGPSFTELRHPQVQGPTYAR